jgi:hypothetical protein
LNKMLLKVTNLKTGKTWTEVNTSHAWRGFALELVKNHPEMRIVYCDIDSIERSFAGEWQILDECGNYEFIPMDEYSIEEVEK